ncbi:MAG: bifunctional glycosyltransferase family 2/GtrA family protein [Bryobacteraceae bacterium]|nr:bifunctional glycosyltransferase family 2/GtrA family protein [Bryobacteraceae bacterium]
MLPDLVRTVLSGEGSPISSAMVVDDGSGPDCEAIFDAVRQIPKVVLVRHVVNLGKGAALKTGFNAALVKWPNAAGLVTADADGQHAAGDILAVAQMLSESPHSLVLGTRQFNGSVPMRSRFGNSLTRRVFQLATGTPVADTQTGLRGWPRKHCLAALRVPLNGYDFELECLVSGRGNIREVPVKTIYLDNNQSSHFNPVLDSMRIYFVFLRYCASGLLAALVDSLIFYAVYRSGGGAASAQVAGRAAAVSVAFLVARNVVFRSDARLWNSLAKYLGLVVVMGFVSFSILQVLRTSFGMPVLVAKLSAEAVLFLGNFAIQRDFIFVRR